MSNAEYNRPDTFVMSVEDDDGRKLRVSRRSHIVASVVTAIDMAICDMSLQIYAPMMPSYSRVRVGMRCDGILLSNSVQFDDLSGVSDMFIPACGAWVGDYPYLDKVQFKAFLSEKLRKERIRRFGRRAPSGLLPEPRDLVFRRQDGGVKEYAVADVDEDK